MVALCAALERGGPWLWPVLIGAVAAVAIALERAWFLAAEVTDPTALLAELPTAVALGPVGLEQLRTPGTLLRPLIAAAAASREADSALLLAELDTLGHQLLEQAEAPLHVLRVLGHAVPLLGLLGTFAAGGRAGLTAAAWLPAVGGLVTGVGATLAHAVLAARLQRTAVALDRVATRLVALLAAGSRS